MTVTLLGVGVGVAWRPKPLWSSWPLSREEHALHIAGDKEEMGTDVGSFVGQVEEQ